MRWFQIDKNSEIFNLANITHFATESHYEKFRVIAYFNFSTSGGGMARSESSGQHHMGIGFSGKAEECEQVIKEIIEGKYDVPLDKDHTPHIEKDG